MLAVSSDNSPAAPSGELDSQGTVSAPVPPETVGGGLVSRLQALFDKRRVTVAELASLLAWLLTGVSFVVTKRSFEDASPLLFQALRFTVGCLTLACVYRRRALALKRHVPGALVVGSLLASGSALQSLALSRTTPTRNAFLTALCVPLTPVILSLFTRKLPPVVTGISAAMAAVGTWMLTDGGGGASWGKGDDLMIGCAILFALHFIALNHFATKSDDAPDALAVGQMLVGALVSWAFVPLDLVDTLFVRVTPALIAGVIVVGALGTGVAFALLAWSQPHVSSSRTAIICSTEPLFAALFAFLILGESLGSMPLGGGGIIVAAIAVSSADSSPAIIALRSRVMGWCSCGPALAPSHDDVQSQLPADRGV